MRPFALLLCAIPLCAASDRTLYDQSSPTIVFRGIAIAGKEFDEQLVIKRCRQFLGDNRNKKLIVLTFVPDEHDATLNAIGCDHCEPYHFWRMQYDEFAKLKFPIGELMAIDNNSVLRYRNRVGAVTDTVLSGSDPRPVALGGFNGKIVHVAMQGLMSKPVLMLYVVGGGSIDSKAGAKYISDFSRRMGVADSTIQFRSDPWFINEIWRTWFPLFEQHRGEPPTEADFKLTKTPDCLAVLTVYGNVTNECSWER